MNEPVAMQEIHKIREKMSLEKRRLSLGEKVACANSGVDELKKLGIKVVDPKEVTQYEIHE